MEFPLSIVAEFATPVLGRIAQAGVVPVVAHPERYLGCSPRVVAAWREVGARIQVDATTLTRLSPRGRRARELLVAGLADVVASDNHGGRRSIRTAAEYLRTRAVGSVDEVVSRLTVDNPRAVVEDREVTDVPPVEIREGVIARLRRVLGG